MPDRNVEIAIKTTADLAGATAAASAISTVETATNKAATAVNPWTTAATSGAQKQVEAHKETAKAMETVGEVQKRTTATANSLADAKDKVTKSTRNAGMAMLTLGRGIQDAQIGAVSFSQSLGGVLNNIEGLVLAAGGTAGLAGVLTIAGVAAATLIPLFKGNADEAKKAADKQHELAQETRKAAEAAEEEARSAAKSTAAMEAQKATLDDLTEKYRSFSDAVAEALKLREEERRAALEESDAQAAADLAEVNKQEKAGAISPQDAENRRREITRGSETRRHEAEQERRGEEEAQKRDEANFKQNKAQETKKTARDLAEKTFGLLTPAEREAAEARLKAAEEKWKDAEKEREAARQDKEQLDRHLEKFPEQRNSPNAQATLNRYKDAAQKGFAAENEREAARRTLALDKEARENSDFTDAKAARAEIMRLKKEADDLKKEAAKNLREADSIGRTKESAGRAFENRQKAGDTNSETRVMEMDKQDKEKADREAERKQKEDERKAAAEQRLKERATRAFRAVAGDAKDMHANPQFMGQLTQAFKGMIAGSEKDGAAMQSLLETLQTHLPKMGARTSKMQNEIDDLKAELKTLREGH